MTIADINDAYRRKLTQEFWLRERGIRVILTSGVLAGNQSIDDILAAVASFNDFNEETETDNEHVVGKIDVNGVDMVWKIEYFAGDLLTPLPDKPDSNKTTRVFTVMLPEEYRAAI